MYTGIVQGTYQVQTVEKKPGLHTLVVELDEERTRDLLIGASVALGLMASSWVSWSGAPRCLRPLW